jgi:hypothetical protein
MHLGLGLATWAQWAPSLFIDLALIVALVVTGGRLGLGARLPRRRTARATSDPRRRGQPPDTLEAGARDGRAELTGCRLRFMLTPCGGSLRFPDRGIA